MKKIVLIYSFNSIKTAKAAKTISEELSKNFKVTSLNAETINSLEFSKYDRLILAVPTWFDGELPNYWDEFVPEMEEIDMAGKKIAIFGNGDQKGYPENFVDGIGILAELIEERGGEVVGHTSAEGYNFERSKALRGEKFVGLALDFENQGKQNAKRIKDWCDSINKEFMAT